jgi:hypothetical protein
VVLAPGHMAATYRRRLSGLTAGELRAIYVPDDTDEAMRDLTTQCSPRFVRCR